MILDILTWTGFIYALLLLASHIVVLAGLAAVFGKERKDLNQKSERSSISVIIPAKNEAENLPALFETLEKQTYSNFEIILVDDRSDDDTASVMTDFMTKYPDRVK